MLAVADVICERTPEKNLLTEVVCWSRMQSEAGQDLAAIVRRKEWERSAGDGLFCWGVGKAPARSAVALARCATDVDVLFSLMKSRPKSQGVAPSGLTIWRSYIDYDVRERELPPASLVTSRSSSATRIKAVHYALMCWSPSPLKLGDFGPFDPRAYRNTSEAAGEVGSS